MNCLVRTDIRSWHAHVYYDPAATRDQAERLREAISDRFVVQLGRWHDRLVGPHLRPMYQVAFAAEHFAALVPWLALNHGALPVLVHPNTLAPRADHTDHALWLGERLGVRADVLPERIEPQEQDPIVPDSRAASAADIR